MTDPLTPERLAETIARVRHWISEHPARAQAQRFPVDDVLTLIGEIDRLNKTRDVWQALQADYLKAIKRLEVERDNWEQIAGAEHARLTDSQAECGALQGELIKAFGERDTMQRRAYSAYVRADSIRALAGQLRKLTRFMLDAEPQSPAWGTAELLARQVLMAIGAPMLFRAPTAAPQANAESRNAAEAPATSSE